MFLAPSLLGVAVFVLMPFLDVFGRSFKTVITGQFVWFENYKTIFTNQAFMLAVKNTFRLTLVCIPLLVVIGLMVAVGILRASGFLDYLSGLIGGVMKYVGFPSELVPLTVVKMFSSSAATGLLLDAFKEYGTDSYIGLVASISMSCTETIFYTMSVYFMTAKVRKTRYTLTGAMLATFAGLVASAVLAGSM